MNETNEKTNKTGLIILLIFVFVISAIPSFYLGTKFANKESIKQEEKQNINKQNDTKNESNNENIENNKDNLKDETNDNNEIEEQTNTPDHIYTKNECFNKDNPCKKEYTLTNGKYKETITIHNQSKNESYNPITIEYNNNKILKSDDIFYDHAIIEEIALLDNDIIVVNFTNAIGMLSTMLNYRLFYSIKDNKAKVIQTDNEYYNSPYCDEEKCENIPINSKSIKYYTTDGEDAYDYDNRTVNVIEGLITLENDGTIKDEEIGKKVVEYTGAQS